MKTASNIAVTLAEYRYLNALIKKPNYWNDSRVTKDVLVSEIAKSVFEALEKLRSSNIRITPQSLLQAGLEIDFNINKQIIDTIFDTDDSGADNLDDILNTLNNASNKNSLINQLEALKIDANKAGDLDKSKILDKLSAIMDYLNKGADSSLITLTEWVDQYLEEMEERRNATRYSYGDVLLDKNIYKSCYPGAITTICAGTGTGKSSFVLYLMNGMIEQNVPCMYLSLEMSATDTFDRLISMRCGIPNNELFKPEMVDSIKEVVEEERKNLLNKKKFLFSDRTNIDLNKLRALIREFKQRVHSDYGVVAVDLITQIKEFMSASNNMSTASSIEAGMNKLNEIAKEENVHILAVAQFNRQSEGIKIHTVEEIDEMRPSLASIKNSGAIAERSRVVLGLHRPKLIADKYLVPINAPGADQLEDIIEVQILKNSNGPSGTILKYMFEPETFKILPVVEEDKLQSLLNDNDFNF